MSEEVSKIFKGLNIFIISQSFSKIYN